MSTSAQVSAAAQAAQALYAFAQIYSLSAIFFVFIVRSPPSPRDSTCLRHALFTFGSRRGSDFDSPSDEAFESMSMQNSLPRNFRFAQRRCGCRLQLSRNLDADGAVGLPGELRVCLARPVIPMSP